MSGVYRHNLIVPVEALDANDHVNNVCYVQWMQDIAIRHADATGCTRATRDLQATWVARSHAIEYLRPAFAGDPLEILTWIADFRKVRSLRRYKFTRTTDQVVLATGQTDWVFVDAATGRPRPIPDQVRNLFTLLSKDQEP